MTENCRVLTPAERQIVDIIHRADQALLATVYKALQDATDQASIEFRSIKSTDRPPAYEYFAAVLHEKMYCLMCGADPETMKGGDPRIAVGVIRNSQNIAKHYWGADIEPYPLP
jgi:Fe2+ or Zn2+ uptake regulation protein